MTDPKDHSPDLSDLRRRAEARLEAQPVSPEDLTPEEAARLIHELQVHQIELQMQNEELRQAQVLLAESRDRYVDLYDFAPVGYLTLDGAGKILEANLAAATLLGLERSRLLKRFFPHFLVEGDRRVFRQLLNNNADQSERRGEFHLTGGNGDVRVVLLDILFLQDAEGRERRRLALTDITELKRTQEELRVHKEDLEELVAERTAEFIEVNAQLREANDNLRALFEAAPLAVGVFDAEGKVISVNPASERIFGWSLEEVQGRLPRSIPAENAESSLEILQGVLQGQSFVGAEITQQRRDGSPIEVSFSAAPLHDAEGRVRGFIGLAEDITERKQTEEALRTQARVLESMAEAVTVTNSCGHITYTNPAFDAMFGYESGELLGRHSNVLNFYPPEENLKVVQEIVGQVEKTGIWSGEFRNCKKDGRPFYTAARISALEVHGKKFFISVQEDITEHQRAEKEIRRLASFPELNPQIVLEVDRRGRVIYANPAARQAAETLGLPEGVRAFLPPDLKQIFAEARQGGSRQYSFDKHFDAAVYAVTLHLPLDLPTARLYALDITARQRAEEALRESEERYRSLFENNHAVMLLIDPETGAIVDANPAAVTYYGYPRQKLLAQKITYLNILPRKEVFREMRRAKRGESKHFEFRHRLASGEIRDVEVFSGPIRIRGRKLLYSIVHDNTARRQAEEALRRAHDELEERVEERTAALRLANEQLLWEIEERQEAEDKLRASEARFAAFMKHLPGLAVMRDVQGRYLFVNEAWEQMTGKTKEDWQGKLLKDIWPRKQALKYQKLDQQVLLAGEPLEALEPLELADGRHYFLSYRFPILDKDGLPYMVGAIGIDITARIQAEQEARHQTRLFEAFFDHTITPLVFLDPQFNFLRVNQAYARACHLEMSDFAGRNHFDFYPHEENEAIFQRVVQTKTPFVAVAKAFEFPDHPEWGTTYWDWSLVPIVNEAGEVDFLVLSLKDVTDQVHAEEERRRLVDILENTPDFVGIADFYGNLLYLNRAGRAMVGVAQDQDVRPLKVLEMHPEWISELILREGAPTARREGAWEAESALLHRDGREIPVSQVILAHKNAQGRVEFFSTIARDISALKEAQDSILRQANILNGINRIFREALTSETEEDLGQACLTVAEELTASRFGFIDELNEQGTFDALAFSDPGWDLCHLAPGRAPAHLQNIPPMGLLSKSIQEGRALIANDPVSHPEAAGLPEGHPPLTAYLGVPLHLGGRTIGLIGLGNKAGGYTPADQEAVETLAPSIVEALSHHRSKEDLKRSERKLRHLADQLLTAQEDERKRLAAELHDELGHALLTLKLAFSSIAKDLPPNQKAIKQKIKAQLDYINEVIEEVRRLYQHLSPGDVEDLGLTRALETLIEDFALYQPQITWRVDLPDLDGLFSLPVQTIIYRIVQEALTNIGKHANPELVTVFALEGESQVHFGIQDDGAGFDMVEVLEATSGLGLAAIEERLNMIGGSFVVWSRKQEGTRLSFAIPTLPEDERS